MNTGKCTLKLGGHVSISGGIEKSIKRGESINCTAIQIFTKSNRQWNAKPISDEESDLFKHTLKQSTIKSVVVHASYLINIASLDDTVSKKSTDALKDELERCDKLDIPYLILHPGTSGSDDPKKCLNRIAENINNIYKHTKLNAVILLEIMAGQGTSVASKFEQLAEIYKQIENKKKIGICFDTCHAFASGYDFRTKESYEKMWSNFDNVLGLQLLKVIHFNDSKKDLGSKIDRHEFIGKGKIGKTAFEMLINDERFLDTIKILEVPVDTIDDYLPDMKLLVSMLSHKNHQLIKNTNLEYLK